jgi:hypothetical protein
MFAVEEILHNIVRSIDEAELEAGKELSDECSKAMEPLATESSITRRCLAGESKGRGPVSSGDNANKDAVTVSLALVEHVGVLLVVDADSMYEWSSQKSEVPSVTSQAAGEVLEQLVVELTNSPNMHVHAFASLSPNV